MICDSLQFLICYVRGEGKRGRHSGEMLNKLLFKALRHVCLRACLFTAAAVQCADICVNVSLEKSQAPSGVCVNNNTVIHPLLI